jgi:signal transduction histidine kinase
LVDDDSADAYLTRRALAACAKPSYHVDQAASLGEASERLSTTTYDVVLLDLGLPESRGIETVSQFRARCAAPPPLIVLTGLNDEAAALETLDQGAQDYLVKGELSADMLSRSIRHARQRHQMLGELQAANEMLRAKNERLAELYNTAQQFVDNVSHEFRTPLTVIREFTSIVRDGCDGAVTPKQVEHLDKVLHRTDDLALMVDDMLDISKLEAGLLGVWRRPCRVGELISSVLGQLKKRADSKGIRFTTNVAHDLPQVFCDEEKAQRVLINLAVNAIKFTPAAGQVEIWARPADDGMEITIGVTDSGPGISRENLAVIFERFRQLETNLRASTKGFGLGLNIAKELVSLNFGQMQVESEIGQGSTFSFTLPANDWGNIFERYVRRVGAQSETSPGISFFTVCVDLAWHEKAVPVVDEYLQRSVRTRDLVIPLNGHTWLLAAACAETDAAGLADRLKDGWHGYARNFPGGDLPGLEMRHCSTQPFAAGPDRLKAEFMRLLESSGTTIAGGKVLVVDDDQEVNSCLGVRLEAAGYEVLAAYDGNQGLAAAIEHHPDAVVLDLRMPNMDGITMLQEMRNNEATNQTPVVVLSANIRDQHRALEAGANYFVAKPYEAATVLTAIKSSLSERSLS